MLFLFFLEFCVMMKPELQNISRILSNVWKTGHCLKIRVFYHRGLRSSAEGRTQRTQSFKIVSIFALVF